jgi:hypothetical protein
MVQQVYLTAMTMMQLNWMPWYYYSLFLNVLPGLISSNVIVLPTPDLGMEYVMSVKMNCEIF